MNQDRRFPDPTLLQLQNEALRTSVGVWRAAYESQRKAGLWLALPALPCAVGVFTLDAPLWVNGAAGATVAGSVTALLMALAGWRQQRRERQVDAALAQRFFDEMEGK